MSTHAERLAYYEDLIPPTYQAGFPANFQLQPTGWALNDDVVFRPDVQSQFASGNGYIRPIGTMDIEFLQNDLIKRAHKGEIDLVKNYPCGLKCPGCFSEDSVYGDRERLMTWQDMFKVIDDARAIGLTSIKFLGPGEFFTNKDAFDIMDACEERGLEFSVFTKGSELGDDELAVAHYGHLGLKNAKDLVRRMSQYKTLRLLLGFNSFDADRQNKMVGSLKTQMNYAVVNGEFMNRGVKDYTAKRDRALQYFVKHGFNDPAHGQRLTLVATPVQLDQIDEMPDIYVWAARRNIPMVIAPTMESGFKSLGLARHNVKIDEDHQKLIDLYVAVYKRAMQEGITTPDQIRAHGISSYMGTASCNQVANGLFVRLNGQVQMCPGTSAPDAIYGNIHDRPIASIWVDSANYSMGAMENNWCTAKQTGMPVDLIRPAVEQRLGL